MRSTLIFLLCAIALGAAPVEKPELYFVRSDNCAPCRHFDRVFTTRPEFRRALEDAFTVRQLDWDKPKDYAAAVAMGVDRVPSFVAYRGSRRIASHVGWTVSSNDAHIDQAIAALMRDLNVEWPPAPVRAPDPPRPALPAAGVDIDARNAITRLATQTKQLQASQERTEQSVQSLERDMRDVKSELNRATSGLQEQLKTSQTEVRSISQTLQQSIERLQSSHEKTQTEVSLIGPAIRKTIEQQLAGSLGPTLKSPLDALPPRSDISAEIPEGSGPPSTSGKWLSVLAWAGKAALTVAAPEVAIPGSVLLTAAGVAASWIRKRRQPAPLGTSSNPITIAEPAAVKTETKFVVHESDVLGEAYKEAIRRVGNAHRENQPEVIELLKQVDAAAVQLAHGQRVSRRPASVPASENAP